ncbi:MAG TPA: tape measure protein [Polyangiaceae bacterium]|nr:tape measure protein [Polyangiaceae bacterium]
MGVDDASFTMQLLDELTAPGRDMGAVLAALKSALGEAGSAAGTAGDAIKGISKDIGKSTDAFKAMDDAMAHQNWVALKQGEIAAAKNAAALNLAATKGKLLAGVSGALSGGLTKIATGLKFIAKWGAIAGAALGAMAGFAAFKLAETAGFAQSSILALTQLTGSAATAAVEFDEVRKMSARFGLNVIETQKSFQKLLAAQFSIGQAKDLIKMGADLQVVTGEAESAQRALLTLSQIKAKGKLQGEELMQLQEAGVSQGLILEALEKALGKDRAEVQKMLSGGKIDAETGVSAIIDAIKHKVGEHELGEAGAKFADTTLKGFIAKSRSGFQNAMINIGQAITPSLDKIGTLFSKTFANLTASGKPQELSATIVGIFKSVAAFLEAKWPRIEALIATGLDIFIGGFKAVGGAVDSMTQSNGLNTFLDAIMTFVAGVKVGFAEVWPAMQPIFDLFSGGGSTMISVAAAMGKALGGLVALLVGAVGVLGVVAGAVVVVGMFMKEAIVGTAQAILQTIAGLIAPILDMFANISAIFDATGMSWAEKLFNIGKQIVMGLVNGLVAMAEAPVNMIAGIGSNIAAAFKGVLGIASPSTVFAQAGMDTAAGFTIGFDTSADKAIADVKSVANDISGAFTGALATPTPANDVTASPVAAALGVEAPTLQGANAQAASAAVQGVAAPAGGSGGVGSISMPITVVAAEGQSTQEVARDVASEVRKALEAIFDKAS